MTLELPQRQKARLGAGSLALGRRCYRKGTTRLWRVQQDLERELSRWLRDGALVQFDMSRNSGQPLLAASNPLGAASSLCAPCPRVLATDTGGGPGCGCLLSNSGRAGSSVALGELARGQRSQDATPTCGFTKLHYTQTGFAWDSLGALL